MKRIDLPKDKLIKLYYLEGLSLRQIADHFGVNPQLIFRNMIRYNLPTRNLSDSHSGKSPWNKGIQSNQLVWNNLGGNRLKWRGKDWEIQRAKRLSIDNHTCQDCGFSSNNPHEITVHHLVLFRLLKNNNLDNLITLCRSCHTKRDNQKIKELINQLQQ